MEPLREMELLLVVKVQLTLSQLTQERMWAKLRVHQL